MDTQTKYLKRKKGFTLRDICGEHIIVAEGLSNVDFSSIISLNESAAYLWRKADGQDFSAEDLAAWLEEEYEVDHATALHDAAETMKSWQSAGIVE